MKNKLQTPTPSKDLLTKLLAMRIGAARGVDARTLANMLAIEPRQIRSLITELREEGMPICGHPSTGYYIAETPAELQATCDFLRSRALKSLVLESRLRKVPLATLIGQLSLDLAAALTPAKEEAQA